MSRAAPEGRERDVAAVIARAMLLSPGEAMRQDEIAAGRKIVRPGDVEWLPRADWIDDVVVSVDRDQVRIVTIVARKIGNGALSRLVSGICAAGLVPVVVQPMGIMPTILRRWGWRRNCSGSGWTLEEQWRPRGSEWMRGRAAFYRSALSPSPGTVEATQLSSSEQDPTHA